MTQQEFILQALREQRNEALDRGAQLAALAADLQKQVNDLQAQLKQSALPVPEESKT